MNASVSVPVQSYRSEGSQALCLVNPWERPHSVLLSENQNTDSIGENTRAGNGGGGRKRKSMKPHISGRFTSGNTVRRREEAWKAKEGESSALTNKIG